MTAATGRWAPSGLINGYGVHDAWLDLDGKLWFTCNVPNRHLTMGRIDPRPAR